MISAFHFRLHEFQDNGWVPFGFRPVFSGRFGEIFKPETAHGSGHQECMQPGATVSSVAVSHGISQMDER